ncbi:hypothetical protein L208DRAFT_1551907 [Tricholoma matsutake]|nr:hypothetical protein L208DRAFT_1551907 [Tricholoma matsutake 945]
MSRNICFQLPTYNINPCVPTLQKFVDNLSVESSSHCHYCNQHLIRTHVFDDFPLMLAFDVSGHTTLLTKSLNITQRNGQCTMYELRGVIYHHTDHFTARIITSDGMVCIMMELLQDNKQNMKDTLIMSLTCLQTVQEEQHQHCILELLRTRTCHVSSSSPLKPVCK